MSNGWSQRAQRSRANVTTSRLSSADKVENTIHWVSFFRANIEIFVEVYFGIKIFPFQKILLHMMDKYPQFMFIATRGIGKSFIVALYACARCVLYPNTKIVIASGSKKQSSLIVTHKIQAELMHKSPILKKEIKKVNTSATDTSVEFWNGSRIDVVTASDNARGYRANLIIYDEFRLIKDEVINRVLKPFLNYTRDVGYRFDPKYASSYDEDNKEIFISSAYFKSHPMYQRFVDYCKRMVHNDKKNTFVCSLSWKTPIRAGLLTQKQIDMVREEETFTELDWIMEYETLFYGLSENAFFSFDHIMDNRKLAMPLYGGVLLDKLGIKAKDRIKKHSGEIRIMGYDVALMGAKKGKDDNDNSVLTHLRCLPESKQFRRQLADIRSISGMTTTNQAIVIKRYFYEHQMDYMVLDVRGLGLGVHDELIKITYDAELNKEYPAWCVFNDDDYRDRAPKDAVPLIYAFNATSERNHQMATWTRDLLQRKQVELLKPQNEAIDLLNELYDYDKKDVTTKEQLLRPFIETEILGIEMMNLESEVKNGYVRVYEKRSARKDRYVSFAMAIYYSKELESKKYNKSKRESNISDFFAVSSGRGGRGSRRGW